MGHTPGPWRWTTVDSDWNEDASESEYKDHGETGPFDALWSDATGQPVSVAQDASSYRARFTPENKADATLIASAPELLEALKKEHLLGHGADPFLECETCKVIRKAEGR